MLNHNLMLPSIKNLFRDYIALGLTLILLFIIGFLLFVSYHPKPLDLAALKQLAVPWTVSVDHLDFTPAPREHFIFITLLLLSPLIVICSIITARKFFYVFHEADFKQVWVQSFIFIVPIILVIIFYRSPYYYFVAYAPFMPSMFAWVLATIIFLKGFLLNPNKLSPLPHSTSQKWLWLAVIIAFLQSFSWRIVNFRVIDFQRPWVLHFDAAFYSVSQAIGGKTALVDYPAQYGLYGELLKPIFTIIPFSVLSFTAILAVLQMIALVALFKVMLQTMRSRWLLCLFLLIIVNLTAEIWHVYRSITNTIPLLPDFYFQYSPIRFVFPAISVWLFTKLLAHFNYRQAALLAFIGAIGVLWNIDSGVPVVGAFLFFLCCQLFFCPKSQARIHIVKMIGVALVTMIGVWLAFFLCLHWQAGKPINLTETIAYQKIFFQLGFAKIPLPRKLSVWMIIICCYLLGMIIAFTCWLNRRPSKTAALIFYLSILGLGLFMYYQGRAHPLNLPRVSWPAWMIVFILADRTLRLIKLKRFPGFYIWLNLPLIIFVAASLMHMLLRLPTIAQVSYNNWHALIAKVPAETEDNLKFIQSHVHNKHSVEILMANQAAYYAEAGLASAITGPGFEETILRKDFNNTMQQLITHPVDQLFLGPTYYSPEGIQEDFKVLFNYYDIKDRNANGILYLTPKGSS